ncbi:MAG: chorismate synthase [Bacillaceae bacterium G1]|nr:MAG: chorismate synthase [Bacillaceae bacterium G1]
MRYLTAGESHGRQLTVIVEGLPSNVPVDVQKINEQLARRQKGYGRGLRMQIEQDEVEIVAGVRHGKTTGAPVCLVIHNKDWVHWQDIMDVAPVPDEVKQKRRVSRPRPGHADLNGAIKYRQRDIRNILERSSARETAARVACGALIRQMLECFDVDIAGHVLQIGTARLSDEAHQEALHMSLQDIRRLSEQSPVRCIDKETEQAMMAEIDAAKKEGDSLGGIVEVLVDGLPVGLGSHVHWDRKLDGRLAQAIMSIQAFKGVEIGEGFKTGGMRGSQVHDAIHWNEERGFYRLTNRAGGIEGGMTTGERLIVRGVMKPIPTLYKPLQSVDLDTKEVFQASIERSDNCAVPAASVVAEAVVAWELGVAFREKFGGDSLEEMTQNYHSYQSYVRGL